jgi:hypothetical protein
MTKKEIINLLNQNHQAFLVYIESLSDADFEFKRAEKWSAGQQLEHLILSINPLNQGFMLPVFLLKLVFGKMDRPSQQYDELVLKYHNAIENGGKASKPYVPKLVSANKKKVLIEKLSNSVKKLCSQIDKCSESDLDNLRLPHPLLGKISCREMMYFTIYHVQHHHHSIEKELQ